MATMTAPAFAFARGDTLRMPVTYRNPAAADGSPGAPIDLTGKICSGRLFNPGRTPLELTAGAGLVVDPAAGLMSFVVDDETSATLAADAIPARLAEGYPDPGFAGLFRAAIVYPTRLQVRVRDPAAVPAPGDIGTIALFAVHLYDPATVDLASLPIGQAATVVASPGSAP